MQCHRADVGLVLKNTKWVCVTCMTYYILSIGPHHAYIITSSYQSDRCCLYWPDSDATTVPATEEEIKANLSGSTTPPPKVRKTGENKEASDEASGRKLDQAIQSQPLLESRDSQETTGKTSVPTAVKAKAAPKEIPKPVKAEPEPQKADTPAARAVQECLNRKNTQELLQSLATPSRSGPEQPVPGTSPSASKATSPPTPAVSTPGSALLKATSATPPATPSPAHALSTPASSKPAVSVPAAKQTADGTAPMEESESEDEEKLEKRRKH